jgi:hypothetical protein
VAFFAFFAAVRLDGARFAATALVRRVLPAVAARARDFRDVPVIVLFFAFDRLLMRGISFLRLMSDSPCANAARHASVCAALFTAAESFKNRSFGRRCERMNLVSCRNVICNERPRSQGKLHGSARGFARRNGVRTRNSAMARRLPLSA